MSEQPEKTDELAVVEETEEVLAAEETAKKEMSMLEKVNIMTALAAAPQNEDVIRVIKSQPKGDLILEIFTDAIEKKIKNIMDGGQEEELPNQVNNIIGAAREMDSVLREFNRMIVGFMGTPLVEVLSMMNKNLGGKGFKYSQLSQQPQQQQPRQEEYQSDDMGPRGSGIGSF